MFKAENYDRFLEMSKIFQRAVKNAQNRHRKNGIPNVYLKNGKKIWELPDGTYTTEDPFAKK